MLIKKKNEISINDLGFLIGPILNAGGRLGKSKYATELLSTDNFDFVVNRSDELIKLNNKRRVIETSIMDKINFKKLQKENNVLANYFQTELTW